jgi:alkylhydroperoxidase/carboxymuconolactone decarboxylase family protein YurZ
MAQNTNTTNYPAHVVAGLAAMRHAAEMFKAAETDADRREWAGACAAYAGFETIAWALDCAAEAGAAAKGH